MGDSSNNPWNVWDSRPGPVVEQGLTSAYIAQDTRTFPKNWPGWETRAKDRCTLPYPSYLYTGEMRLQPCVPVTYDQLPWFAEPAKAYGDIRTLDFCTVRESGTTTVDGLPLDGDNAALQQVFNDAKNISKRKSEEGSEGDANLSKYGNDGDQAAKDNTTDAKAGSAKQNPGMGQPQSKKAKKAQKKAWSSQAISGAVDAAKDLRTFMSEEGVGDETFESRGTDFESNVSKGTGVYDVNLKDSIFQGKKISAESIEGFRNLSLIGKKITDVFEEKPEPYYNLISENELKDSFLGSDSIPQGLEQLQTKILLGLASAEKMPIDRKNEIFDLVSQLHKLLPNKHSFGDGEARANEYAKLINNIDLKDQKLLSVAVGTYTGGLDSTHILLTSLNRIFQSANQNYQISREDHLNYVERLEKEGSAVVSTFEDSYQHIKRQIFGTIINQKKLEKLKFLNKMGPRAQYAKSYIGEYARSALLSTIFDDGPAVVDVSTQSKTITPGNGIEVAKALQVIIGSATPV